MTRVDEMSWCVRPGAVYWVALAVLAPVSCTVEPLPLRTDGAGEAVPVIDAGLADHGSPDGSTRVTFATDIFPLLKKSCSCHVERSVGPALDSYSNVLSAANNSNTAIQNGTMPLSGPLSATDRALFQSWIDAGKPE
jgi:hypothetical protein